MPPSVLGGAARQGSVSGAAPPLTGDGKAELSSKAAQGDRHETRASSELDPEPRVSSVRAEGEAAPFGFFDPLALVAASAPGGPGASAEPSRFGASLPPLLSDVVRAMAWGGDRRRGTARLELAGRYGGTTIRVDAEGGTVALEVEAPVGVDGSALGERVAERLRAKGLRVGSLVVR